jgi:predicted lipoprotein with Yx(FWY)xxD motif
MQKLGTVGVGLLLGALTLAVLAALYASRSDASGTASKAVAVVTTARNATLGKTILVNRKGMTLYSLSAETNVRFICTDAFCRSLWTPLVVARGTTPTGSRSLDTVKRPDGRTQVRFRGLPLYTFNEDAKPGDTKGEGFKDVGTWLAATTVATRTPSPAPAATPGYGGPGY